MFVKKKKNQVQSDLFNSKNVKFDRCVGKPSMCFPFLLTTTTFTTLLTPDVLVFHTSGSSPRHKLGVL